MFGAVESVIDAGHDPRRSPPTYSSDSAISRAASSSRCTTRGVVDAPEECWTGCGAGGPDGPATLTRYAEVVHAGLTEMRGATAAPAARGDLRAAAAAVGQRCRIGAAATRRADRDQAGHVHPCAVGATSGRRGRRGPLALRQAAPAPVARRTEARRPPEAEPPSPARRGRPRGGGLGRTQRRRGPNHVADGARQGASAQPNHRGDAGRRHRPCGRGQHAGADPRSAPLAKRLSEQRNADVIAEALKDALGVNWRVRCEAGASTRRTEAPATRRAPSSGAIPCGSCPRRAEEASRRRGIRSAGRRGEHARRSRPDEASAPRRDPEEVALELLQKRTGRSPHRQWLVRG